MQDSKVLSPTKNETGLACIYVRHELGTHMQLRPAYDSPPAIKVELTARQLDTLMSRAARYATACRRKNELR